MKDLNNDVVLQRIGDKTPVTIGNEKCLIRTVLGNERVDCCAIFNGPNGTAMRSYRPGVLVNGEPTSVRQLSSGDVIELPCMTKIEIQQATQIRPVVSQRERSSTEVDQQLAAIQTPNAEELNTPESNYLATPTSEKEDDGGEKFHSPFSTDLPEITPESLGQPVTSTAAPENQLSPADATPVPPVSDQKDEQQDLGSIFAKVGVTNVGSIANPVAQTPVAMESAAMSQADVSRDPKPESPVVGESASAATPSLDQSVIDEATAIRKQLEASFLEISEPSPTEVPVPQEPVPAQAGSASSPTPSDPQPTPVAAVPVVEPVVPEVSVTPAPEMPKPVAQSVLPSAAATVAAAATAVTAAHVATTSTTNVEKDQEDEKDPLAELPADLRDQLNDLVSSLKTSESQTAQGEIAAIPQPIFEQVPVVPLPAVEPVVPQPAAVAETPPVAVPTPVEAASPIEPVAAQPVEPVAPPVEKDNRSVADILGAMGMAIPGDDEVGSAVDSTSPVTASQPESVAPAPEPARGPDQEVPVSPVFAKMAQDAEAQNAAPVETNAEDDIQAYMNKLLNRGDAPAQPQPQSASPVGAPASQNAAPQPEEVKVLSPDEFVPNNKPSRPENYDTLREIANTSSRTAIEQSSTRKSGGSMALKATACIMSLLGAALTHYWLQVSFPTLVFLFVAIMCLMLCFLDGSSSMSKLSSQTTEPNAQ